MRALLILGAFTVTSCSSPAPAQVDYQSGREHVTASARTLPFSVQDTGVIVRVVLRNDAASGRQFTIMGRDPVRLNLFSGASTEPVLVLTSSADRSGRIISLAPRDSIELERSIPMAQLFALPAGLYRIRALVPVAVDSMFVVDAGQISLPFSGPR